MPNQSQKVRIPLPFREFTGGNEFVEVSADNVDAALMEMWTRFPVIKEQMIDEHGGLRRFVNIYVNEEDIRVLQDRETPLNDGDQISIIPALIAQDSAIAAIAVANQLRMNQRSKN